VRFWRSSGWVSVLTLCSVDHCSCLVDVSICVVSLVMGRDGRLPGAGFLRWLILFSDGYCLEPVG